MGFCDEFLLGRFGLAETPSKERHAVALGGGNIVAFSADLQVLIRRPIGWPGPRPTNLCTTLATALGATTPVLRLPTRNQS